MTKEEIQAEAAEIASLKESEVPYGQYVMNGILVDCDGQPIRQAGKALPSTHHAVGSSPVAPEPEKIDFASMSKEELLKLPEAAEIDGAKNMAQADLAKAMATVTE